MRARTLRRVCAFAIASALLATGCYREHRASPAVDLSETEAAEHPKADAIRLSRTQVGAEVRPEADVQPAPEAPAVKRELLFVVTGFGETPETGGLLERRAAAVEAAVVDALGRAIRQKRRDPKTGTMSPEYRVELSPRLIVVGQLVRGAFQTAIRLTVDRAGKSHDYELCVLNGVLAEPPHDRAIIDEIFQAAGGEFVLQSTGPTPEPGRYRAEVACYRVLPPTAATQTAVKSPPIIATGR